MIYTKANVAAWEHRNVNTNPVRVNITRDGPRGQAWSAIIPIEIILSSSYKSNTKNLKDCPIWRAVARYLWVSVLSMFRWDNKGSRKWWPTVKSTSINTFFYTESTEISRLQTNGGRKMSFICYAFLQNAMNGSAILRTQQTIFESMFWKTRLTR